MLTSFFLDNDQYKFSMQQLAVHKFPDVYVRYKFINRGSTPFSEEIANRIRMNVMDMEKVCLSADEYEFLSSIPFLKKWYLDWLKKYRYDSREVQVERNGNELVVTIEGPWCRTILWEVPLMAIISQTYYEVTRSHEFYNRELEDAWEDKAYQKGLRLSRAGVNFADFGTRRRFSLDVHDKVIQALSVPAVKTFVGTSNVHFAHKYGLKAIGTCAHEDFMVMSALFGVEQANCQTLEHWSQEYRGDLGIALTDTYTTPVFLKTFDKFFAKLFDGVRQDSGDPFEFINTIVNHYKKFDIDPLTKTIVFSDGLNVDLAIQLAAACRGIIQCSFGIGTFLTNDVGFEPLNIVIKVSEVLVNDIWVPVVKLSDNKGKHTGDPKRIKQVKSILDI